MTEISGKDQLLSRDYQVGEPADIALWAWRQSQGLDGYDMMHIAAHRQWRPLGAWGERGWDLGQWPFVIIFTRRASPDAYELAYYVEGDVTMYRYPTRELLSAAIDAIAFGIWHACEEPWVDGISSADDMPSRLCGPYRPDREPSSDA